MMKEKIAKSWKTLPSAVRKTLAAVIGSTLIILGSLLIVLPGPFTLPLVILGLFVLGLEYAWARRTLEKVKEQGAKFNPLKLFKK
ncbi:PGPGW domain-containing protein [Candidatus Planktophila dulcis]|jgi:drug/metabolite transporter (DMT)-like permease|uniref:PGPGW domain-containing protein n=2 Tax=Candidatus Planktophila dulcis TaxID=1884914 RepID=UPI00268C87C5